MSFRVPCHSLVHSFKSNKMISTDVSFESRCCLLSEVVKELLVRPLDLDIKRENQFAQVFGDTTRINEFHGKYRAACRSSHKSIHFNDDTTPTYVVPDDKLYSVFSSFLPCWKLSSSFSMFNVFPPFVAQQTQRKPLNKTTRARKCPEMRNFDAIFGTTNALEALNGTFTFVVDFLETSRSQVARNYFSSFPPELTMSVIKNAVFSSLTTLNVR